MNVYQITLTVVDLEGVASKGFDKNSVRDLHNLLISGITHVRKVEERDIGEFTDAHPLNWHTTAEEGSAQLFGPV